jgi:hypothetical protein
MQYNIQSVAASCRFANDMSIWTMLLTAPHCYSRS